MFNFPVADGYSGYYPSYIVDYHNPIEESLWTTAHLKLAECPRRYQQQQQPLSCRNIWGDAVAFDLAVADAFSILTIFIWFVWLYNKNLYKTRHYNTVLLYCSMYSMTNTCTDSLFYLAWVTGAVDLVNCFAIQLFSRNIFRCLPLFTNDPKIFTQFSHTCLMLAVWTW